MGKMSRRLLSPQFKVSQPSCLQFDYFGQGQGREAEVKTISVTLISTSVRTIWKAFGVIDNNWHAGKAAIEPGTFRLRFDINGDEYRGGFDDILVTPGACTPLSKCVS